MSNSDSGISIRRGVIARIYKNECAERKEVM